MPPKLRRSSQQTPMPQKRRRTSMETTESQQGLSSEMLTEPLIKQRSELLPAPVPFKWTTERSVELLFSMTGLKPAGLHKHLNVTLIKQRVSKRLNMNVPIEEIWTFLHAHWNLELADKVESQEIFSSSWSGPEVKSGQSSLKKELNGPKKNSRLYNDIGKLAQWCSNQKFRCVLNENNSKDNPSIDSTT